MNDKALEITTNNIQITPNLAPLQLAIITSLASKIIWSI